MGQFLRGGITTLLTGAAFALLAMGAARADSLLAHRVSYALALDASRPSQKLDGANGQLDYEIKGGSCPGYTVNLRQSNLLDTGEGSPLLSEMVSTSWEDADGEAYRFKMMDRVRREVKSHVEGLASRSRNGITVQLTQPKNETVDLTGHILMPTEHVRRVIAAASAGEATFEARVFDGAENGRKVYSTLAVIGRPAQDGEALPDAARASLAGQTSYPVTISYFDEANTDAVPDYVMSVTLYTNGVISRLKIDYGDFVLKGVMTRFEALPAAAPCGKDAGK